MSLNSNPPYYPSSLLSTVLMTSNKGTFKIRKASNRQYYWLLFASNGEILCASETYYTKQSAENGIRSCIEHAMNAKIIDESY